MTAALLAVAAGLCWGIGEVATKSALHSGRVGPLTAIAFRSTVALPVLWAAWWAAGRGALGLPVEAAAWRQPDAATVWKLVLGSGLVAGAGGMAFFYAALAFGEVSRVKPIAFTMAPAVGVLLAWALLGEPLGPRKLLAIGLIIAGVILLTGR